MTINKAFVDTTILTDHPVEARNTRGGSKHEGRSANLPITELPTYAIKEFKRGPLAELRVVSQQTSGT